MPMFLITREFPRRTWQTPFRVPLVVTVAMAVASRWAAALLRMAERVSHFLFGTDVFRLTYPSTGKWATEFGSTIGHPNLYLAFQVLSIPLTACAIETGTLMALF